MKKKLLILSVIMLLMIALFSANVYAAEISSATITITPSKTEYESGETIEFTVSVKDLQASSGIVGLGAYVDYDSNLLTLNNVATGLSGWADADISESSNRFATTKNGHSSNNEDIVVIKFTAKDVSSNTQTSVGLKRVEISNGSEYDIEEIKSNSITIKPSSGNSGNSGSSGNPSTGTDTPTNPTTPSNPSNPGSAENPSNPSTPGSTYTPGGTENPTNPNNPSNSGSTDTPTNPSNPSNSGNSSNTGSSLPSTIPSLGLEDAYLPILISLVVVIALVFFVRIKLINNKINKERENFIDKE